MPQLAVVALRIALVYLLAGFTFGALVLADRGTGWFPGIWILAPLHRHVMLWGWTLHLIVGVAYWILPTFGARTNRGRERLVIASLVLLNLGVACAVAVTLAPGAFASGAVDALWGGAHVATFLAMVAFAAHLWPRIKPFGAKASS